MKTHWRNDNAHAGFGATIYRLIDGLDLQKLVEQIEMTTETIAEQAGEMLKGMAVASAMLILSMTATAFAQYTSPSQATISVPCLGDLSSSRPCKSFDELIKAKDDIGNTVATADEAFACFEPEEDRFSVIDFDLSEYSWVSDSALIERQWGSVRVQDFANGSPSNFHYARGRWQKAKTQSDSDAIFVSDDSLSRTNRKQPLAESTKVFIDSANLSVSYSFTNRSGTKTLVEASIRRSTGRFTESFSWQEPRGGKQTLDLAGRCLHYRQGALISQQ